MTEVGLLAGAVLDVIYIYEICQPAVFDELWYTAFLILNACFEFGHFRAPCLFHLILYFSCLSLKSAMA